MQKEFLRFPRDAKLYLTSQFLLAGYYTWPFWFGFASERITASQFGVYLAIGYIVGLIAEVPTGAFADSFGRKQSAVIGALCGVLIPLIVYIGGDFSAYIIAAIVAGIGSAFISGSLESHLYELPGMNKTLYRRVLVQDTYFWQAGLIVSTALGGLMYSLVAWLPFVMQSLSFIVAAVFIMQISSAKSTPIEDDSYVKNKANPLINYFNTNKIGFLHLFTVRKLWPLILFGSTLGVLTWMSIENINEAAMIHYGIVPSNRGLLLSSTKIIALLVLNFIVLKMIKTDRHKLMYLCLLVIFVFGLYSFDHKGLFLIAFLGFNLISSVHSNFIKPIIHDHIDNQWRATAISSYSFVGSILQVVAALVIGVILQSKGVIFVQRALLLLFVLIAVPTVLRYLSATNELTAIGKDDSNNQ